MQKLRQRVELLRVPGLAQLLQELLLLLQVAPEGFQLLLQVPEDMVHGALLVIQVLGHRTGLLLEVALRPLQDLALLSQELLEGLELVSQLRVQAHSDSLEVVLLALDVLAEGLDAGLELFQGEVHVAALLPQVPLKGAQPILQQALGTFDGADLVVEFTVDALQGG
ncbi:MAG TPA: hypothetical protein VLG48_09160 [Candidatus Methylomirabilis sp.]|nr:hypothetical protein [Candidatus Methylomirabilis sp.]